MNEKILICFVIVFMAAAIMTVSYKIHGKQSHEAIMGEIETYPPITPSPKEKEVVPPVEKKPLSKPKSYAEAIAQSKETSKKIVLFFTMNGCPPCSRMKTVIADAEVQKAFEEFVFYEVKLEADEALFSKYQINSTPTTMVVDNSEKVLNSTKGYQAKKQFLSWLEKN